MTLLDKGRGPGGRLATRRVTDQPFDTGAQFFSVRDGCFGSAVQQWTAAGVVREWCAGFPALGQPHEAGDGHPRYLAVGGMNRLAKHLAQGFDLRARHTATKLVQVGDSWQVHAENPDLPGQPQTLTSDAVVLTAPGPQTARLLEFSGLPVDPRLAAVRYAECCCLLLDFPEAVDAVLPMPGGLRVVDDAVVTWIASQRRKGLRATGSTGDGLVVHTSPAWSSQHFSATDDDVLAAVMPAVTAVLRRAGITATPSTVHLKKWRYSLPTVLMDEPCLRVDTSAALLIAGDSCGGRPRMEGAWLSGRAAAELLISG